MEPSRIFVQNWHGPCFVACFSLRMLFLCFIKDSVEGIQGIAYGNLSHSEVCEALINFSRLENLLGIAERVNGLSAHPGNPSLPQ